jgi:hypothetical protein
VIQTDRVYPILILSGLAKEVLGHIWSMCNKMTPGQLIKEELYLVLGFIFLAQVNSKYKVLHCCVCPRVASKMYFSLTRHLSLANNNCLLLIILL